MPLSRTQPTYLDERHHVLLVLYAEQARLPAPKGDEEIVLNNPEITFGDNEMADSNLMIRAIRYEYSGLAPQYLPASVFAGLYDVSDVSIDAKGQNTVVKIAGGDASSSYRAEIELAPYGAIRRTVYNRTSGYTENTEYRYPLNMVLFRNDLLKKRQVDSRQPACQSMQERQKNRGKR
jgi:hypothetical protein